MWLPFCTDALTLTSHTSVMITQTLHSIAVSIHHWLTAPVAHLQHCLNDHMQSQWMEKAKFWSPINSEPLQFSSWNLVCRIMSKTSGHALNFFTTCSVGLLSTYVQYYALLSCLSWHVFAQFKPVDGFSRLSAQMMWFHARTLPFVNPNDEV